MLWLIWALVLVATVVLYFRRLYSRFSDHGVKNLTAIAPFGNQIDLALKRSHFAENLERVYYSYPHDRFVGFYDFLSPYIVIRDMELIKKIAVKDFEHFIDHRQFVDEEVDPLFGRNLFMMKGEEWKDMRSTLSPAFTSSKIRLMVPFMTEVGDQMISSLKKNIKDSGLSYIDVDVKDLATRYANDVIASCAFGLKVDSHMERDNSFYRHGKKAATFNFAAIMKIFITASLPRLSKFLKVSLLSEETKCFFRDLVMSTMRNREAHNIIRSDMIHLLMEAKKGTLTHEDKSEKDADAGFATVEESHVGKKSINRAWSDDDLTAQAVLFFIGGFESISTVVTFLLTELALNPDIQERLYEEIKDNEINNNYKFDYNSVQRMKYLDMVVSELLRLWPAGINLDRRCVKAYNLGRPNQNATEDYIINPGEGITIPVWAIHRDPQYFPDPLKFDPERFSDKNKHNINPWTYMPFGLGPRNCIGSRFALCELKVMVYQLLLHMQMDPCNRTTIPPRLSTEDFNIRLQGGAWLRVTAREI